LEGSSNRQFVMVEGSEDLLFSSILVDPSNL
jgi:hypothetical protein